MVVFKHNSAGSV